MVFFCFSSKDRQSIVESILFHLTNYGIPVWYDRHKMLMGDKRNYKNFVEGVGYSKYAIVILSPNSIANGCCAREEIMLIEEKYKSGDMTVFPIFFNLKATDIPQEFLWMKDLVYKELVISSDSLSTCNHIICKILLDELSKYRIKSVNDFLFCKNGSSSHMYLKSIMYAYTSISDENRDAQISLLYAGYLYIKTHFGIKELPEFYYKGAERLFGETRLHLPIDLRESLIMERIFLLLINTAVFGYII